jgi:hypothetical protein
MLCNNFPVINSLEIFDSSSNWDPFKIKVELKFCRLELNLPDKFHCKHNKTNFH